MKKILATLLVAAMLMSCLTFVSFAAAGDVYTNSTYPVESMAFIDGSVEGITDLYGATCMDNFLSIYNTYVNQGAALKAKAYGDLSPIFAALREADSFGGDVYNEEEDIADYENLMADITSVTKDEVIAMPIFFDSLYLANVDLEYDPAVLTPVENTNNFIKSVAMPSATGKTGRLQVSIVNDANGKNDLTGLAGVAFFVVNADAKTGNEDQTLTTTIKFALDTTSTNAQNLSKIENAGGAKGQIGAVNAMSVNLTGIEYDPSLAGGEEGGDEGDDDEVEKVTGTDFAAATVAAKGLAASGFAADTTGVNVVAGDANSNNYKATDVYSCIFAEVPVIGGYEAIAKAGICLVSGTGHKSYYPSLTTGANTNKFGMVFFGEETLLEKYTAYVYVEYADGTRVLSDASYTLIGE